MGFSRVLFVTVVALFVSYDLAGAVETVVKGSTTTSTDALIRGHSIVGGGRSLRVDQAADAENDVLEERLNLWTKISKPVQVKLWRWRGKSDDFVKNALGLKALSGEALKRHPNYKTFERFQMNRWYRSEKLTTLGAWERLKLSDIPAGALRETDEFLVYARYVNIFDNNAMRAIKAKRETPPLVSINSNSEASKQEMLQRAWIWGVMDRSEEYVLKTLGMDELVGYAFVRHANSEYYQAYLSGSLDRMVLTLTW